MYNPSQAFSKRYKKTTGPALQSLIGEVVPVCYKSIQLPSHNLLPSISPRVPYVALLCIGLMTPDSPLSTSGLAVALLAGTCSGALCCLVGGTVALLVCAESPWPKK